MDEEPRVTVTRRRLRPTPAAPTMADWDDDGSEADADAEEERERPRRRRREEEHVERADAGQLEHTRAHPPPSMSYLVAHLGQPERDRSKCWLCHSFRMDSTAVSLKKYNKMMRMYLKGRVDTDPIVLSLELADHFEEEIRKEANQNLREGQLPVPQLRGADIYWHCRTHVKDASNRLLQRLDELQEIGDTMFQNALFKPVVNSRGRTVLVPRKKYVSSYLRVLTQERLFRREHPENHFLYTQDYALGSEVHGFINVQRPWYWDNVPTSFLGGESQARQSQMTQVRM